MQQAASSPTVPAPSLSRPFPCFNNPLSGIRIHGERTCERCGAPLRYDIVLFEESLDPEVMESAYTALAKCDLFIAAGTSGIVWPSAGFAEIASRAGARTLLVNLESLPTRWFEEQLVGKAEEIFPELFDYQGV